MIILGIDPGTIRVGYALLESGIKPRLLASGLLSINSVQDQRRLEELHLGLKKLIEKWQPEIAAVERLFFAKNTKTALAVAEARGVILLTTALAQVEVAEYTPLEMKKIVTGEGSADKTQVQKMIRLTLKETNTLKVQDDVFDAIGLALACNWSKKFLPTKDKGRVFQ